MTKKTSPCFSLYFVFSALILTCKAGSLCEYATEDGFKYDFESLRNNEKDYSFVQDKYTYKANFCGPLVSKCQNGPNAPAAYFFSTNNVCLSKLSYNWHPTVTYIDSVIKTIGVKINLPDGEKCYVGKGNHKVTYIMKCDASETLKFVKADKINACSVEYEFLSKTACQLGWFRLSFSFTSDGSLITPKNILITCGFVLFLYFVLFTYYNYKRNPEDGLVKALPNREFWSEFVTNIGEGFSVTINYIKRKIGGNKQEYDSV